MNIIVLNVDNLIKFEDKGQSTATKAVVEITNTNSEQNATFKFRTTAPKLFVVKPIHGIIQPGRTVNIDIHLQKENITTIQEFLKSRIMVMATVCELSTSENFKLQKFWEEKAKIKDKNVLQTIILNIQAPEVISQLQSKGQTSDLINPSPLKDPAPQPPLNPEEAAVKQEEAAEERPTIVVNSQPGRIQHELAPVEPSKPAGGTGLYEKAPTEDINISMYVPSAEIMMLKQLESECVQLQEDIDKIKRTRTGVDVKWIDGATKEQKRYSVVYLSLIFFIMFGLGHQLMG